jgi:endonuclease/exonuclease/phosphatase (EEP) superfamily protein YafD
MVGLVVCLVELGHDKESFVQEERVMTLLRVRVLVGWVEPLVVSLVQWVAAYLVGVLLMPLTTLQTPPR